MAIKELEMTWGERLRTEGALSAKREVLLDLVRTRFGAVLDVLAGQAAFHRGVPDFTFYLSESGCRNTLKRHGEVLGKS